MDSTRALARCLALLLLLTLPAAAWAQEGSKKPLDHDAYDIWNSIGSRVVSPDGTWVVYEVSPGEGDGILRIRTLSDGGEDAMVVDRGADPAITPDSRFLIFTIEPMEAVVDSLEAEGTRGDDLPKDSLGIVDLSRLASGSAEVVRRPRVRSWEIPEDEGAYLAYLLEEEEAEEEEAEPSEEEMEEPRGPEPEGQEEAEEEEERDKEEGTPLIFRDLQSGSETRFEDVTAYAFSEEGAWLVYTASNEEGTADGIYAVDTDSGEARGVLAGEGEYTGMTIADDEDRLAFLTNRDDWEADQPEFTLYHAMLDGGEAQVVARQGTPGIPDGWWVSEHGDPAFSDDGTRLFFGTAPRPEPEPEEEVPEDERVVVDIWNWKDPLIQPMQKVRADRERERTYLAYASTGDWRVVQLATEEIREVVVPAEGEGDVAAGLATLKYGPLVSHDATYGDIYLIDMATGEAELVVEKLRNPGLSYRGGFSPDGRYLYYWEGFVEDWFVMDVEERVARNVTEDLPHPVWDELDDHPQTPPPYGAAGWLEDDQAFLVYDRFDLWSVDPTNSRPPENLTEGVGRENNIRFRYVDPEADYSGFGGALDDSDPIPADEDVLLSAFHIYTKQDGFYRDRFDGARPPRQLLMEDFAFSTPRKPDEADLYVLTRQTFEEYPDLWVTDLDFQDWDRISHANPQQAEYLWGSAELVEWTSNDGIPLQGVLIKPENFDPSEEYPMMVYFYERMSDRLHRYTTIRPGGSSVIPAFYVSRGYVFFIPDIPYEIGHPGESALDAVVPGVLKVVDEGYVDSDRIGVQGHSWGGYQIAYMITRTNLFAAAEAGAPVSNMTSAYGGIRWGSGMSRQFQYERTQSRIGGSLWEETLRYLNNSPLFEADKIRTPLLMMHNDEDTAVPWYQGIEMYMAMRRLERPVWLLNYNGEPHGLRRDANRKDWMIRMQQFFDHYLKGAPAPVWMEEGVPAVEKGRNLGLELTGEGG